MTKKVFIIEKELIVGCDLKNKLQEDGCKAINVANLSKAKEVMQKDMPELLIIDLVEFENDDSYIEIETLCKSYAVPMITIGDKNNNEKVDTLGHFSKPFLTEEITDLAIQYFEQEENRRKTQLELLKK